MSKDRWPRPARGWGWTDWVPPILCFLVGGWFLMSLTWLVGAVPGGEPENTGTAEIASCHRDPVRLWMVYTCEADVRLTEPPRIEHTLTSVEPLSGTVDVELAGVVRSHSEVVPADRPHWSLGDVGLWIFLVELPGIGAFMALGISISHRLGLRAPQAPPEPKDFRGVRRLPAGPRRGKRKRRTR